MTIIIKPLEDKPLAAEVIFPEGCSDPTTLPSEDIEQLKEALHKNLVLVIPGMENLSPNSQWKLTSMFDPTCLDGSKDYGHGKEFRHNDSILKDDGVAVANQPQVQILGEGEWNGDCYGMKNIQLKHPTHFNFHQKPLTYAQAFEQNLTRFYRWHIDSALYDLAPPVATTLLGIHVPPQSRIQKIVYEDTGDELHVTQGATAFVSGATAFELLSPKDQERALGTTVIYAPYPYIFISSAKATSDGLTMVSEGKEIPLDKLPPWEYSKIKRLPLVWTNPITKKHHLQVHGCCIHQLELPDGNILELEDARKEIYRMMRPAIHPKHVYAHSWKKGDLVIFFNRGVWHTVTGQFAPGERRLMRQCNIASGTDPVTLLKVDS